MKLVKEYQGKTGDVNIVELQGTTGFAPANDRKEGFADVIKADPKFKVIASQTGEFTRAKSKEVMEAFLKANSKIDVLYAHKQHRMQPPAWAGADLLLGTVSLRRTNT